MADGFLLELSAPCKQCGVCRETKPLVEFYIDKRSGKHCSPCRSCILKRTSSYQKANPEKVSGWCKKSREKNPERYRERWKKYASDNAAELRRRGKINMRTQKLKKMGITKEQLQAAFDEQRGLCAICNIVKVTLSGGRQTHLDHCHKTMKFRGILCLKCNTALGKFGDSPERLERAAAYLRDQLYKVAHANNSKASQEKTKDKARVGSR